MAETKLDKLKRIPAGDAGQAPLPEVPKLPQSFYARHPEDKAELDAYREAWVEFFKKIGSRAS